MTREVDYSGVGADYVTHYRKASSTGAIEYLLNVPYPFNDVGTSNDIGKTVSIAEDKTARIGQDGDMIAGVLAVVENDVVNVQFKGYALVSYQNDGDKPVYNRGVVCDGVGGVRIASAGSEHKERGRVDSINTTDLKCWVFLG